MVNLTIINVRIYSNPKYVTDRHRIDEEDCVLPNNYGNYVEFKEQGYCDNSSG